MAAKIQKPNQERPDPFEDSVAQVGQEGDAGGPRAVGRGESDGTGGLPKDIYNCS